MGCDIHSLAQAKKNGQWKTVKLEIGGGGRSYTTFGALANVRNGWGFAGVDTGDGLAPIDQPRGLPTDFQIDDEEYHKLPDWVEHSYDSEQRSFWMGDHSHSWLLLSELEKYVEEFGRKFTIRRGYIPEEKYIELRGTNKAPESWSGGISGPQILTMSAAEYNSMTEKVPEGARIFVQHSWQESYLDATYLRNIVDDLRAVATSEGISPDEVRMVFGFDS